MVPSIFVSFQKSRHLSDDAYFYEISNLKLIDLPRHMFLAFWSCLMFQAMWPQAAPVAVRIVSSVGVVLVQLELTLWSTRNASSSGVENRTPSVINDST